MKWLMMLAACAFMGACDDGDSGSEAQRAGIGDECAANDECPLVDGEEVLSCLPFRGGYCGADACMADEDCPAGSACVTHEGAQYCFLVCEDKVDCNGRRAEENASNCVANLDFLDDRAGRKVCVPPSSGS